MKKIINYTLSTIITFSALNVRAEEDPLKNARAQAKQTKMQAMTYAQSLVKADLSSALVELFIETSKAGRSTPLFSSYVNDVNALESRVQSLITDINQTQGNDLSNDSLTKLWDEYKNAVRKRFETSFQVQSTFYDQSIFIKSAQNVLSKFKNVCKSGRSEKDIQFDNPNIPNLPPVRSEIRIQYESGPSGSGISDVSYQSSSASGKDKDKQTTNAVVAAGASVVFKVAATGGAGQMAAACAVAAPYVAAAVVVYAAVSHFAAAEEERAMQEKIIDANLIMFREAATDKDVANYYRETCNTIEPLITKMENQLKLINGDAADRKAAVVAAEKIRPQFQAFEDANAEVEKYTPYVTLYQQAENNLCLAQADTKKDAACFIKDNHYVLVADEKVVLPLNKNEMEKIAKPMVETLNKFGKDYPAEVRADIATAKVVLALAPNWEMTANSLNEFSFETVDSSMASLFQKIQILFAQLRADKNAEWNKRNTEIAEELEAVKTFEKLKVVHRQLVNEGIKVVFNRTSREEFQKKVASYIEQARSFSHTYSTNKEVKSFMTSVNALARMYKSL